MKYLLDYIALPCTELHCTALNWAALHCTAQQFRNKQKMYYHTKKIHNKLWHDKCCAIFFWQRKKWQIVTKQNCDKQILLTKLKNSISDTIKVWQKYEKGSNIDRTQTKNVIKLKKIKLWHNAKTQIVSKVNNSNLDQTKNRNSNKTQFPTKLNFWKTQFLTNLNFW